jgi:hypothetical protein
MNIILPHAHFDESHLAQVKNEMLRLGAPTVKAIDCGEFLVSLEGSHRLRAAYDLGLTPVIDEVEYSETVMTDDVVPGSFDNNWSLADIVADAHRSIMLTFDE